MLFRAALLSFTCANLLVTLAHAAVIVDQQHSFVSGVANSTNGNVSEVGQTFTVGISGTLHHVDVLMFRLGGIFDPTDDPIFSLYATSGGVPVGSPLATSSVLEAVVPVSTASFVTFDISSAAIPVIAGDVFAWGIRSNSSIGSYFLLADGDTGQPSDYTDGDAVSRELNPPGGPPDPWSLLQPAQDHGFRTFVVAVPEPGSFCLLGIGVLAMVAKTRVRKIR